MVEQKITSKNTSLVQIPRLITTLEEAPFENFNLLDYGAGRNSDAIKVFCQDLGYKYFAFDPFWGPEKIKKKKYDLVLCANVLCILTDDVLLSVCRKLLKFKCEIRITVHIGDSSGMGKISMLDCYQRNQRLCFYKGFIEEMTGRKVFTKNKVLYIEAKT